MEMKESDLFELMDVRKISTWTGHWGMKRG